MLEGGYSEVSSIFRMSADSIVEFILHHSVELLGGRGIPVIIYAALGKNVGDLLPDAPLAGPDGTDAF